VSKTVNSLKGTLTMEQLYHLISLIKKNKKNTKNIKDKIINGKLKPVDKKTFDEYIKNNYDEKDL